MLAKIIRTPTSAIRIATHLGALFDSSLLRIQLTLLQKQMIPIIVNRAVEAAVTSDFCEPSLIE